jgi:hypothetical protein
MGSFRSLLISQKCFLVWALVKLEVLSHHCIAVWLEPTIALAHNYGLSGQQIEATQQLVEAHADEIFSN